jgi:hypothetical protein
MKSLAERFWPKVDKRGADECWPWIGQKSRGKPTMCIKPTTVSARKVAWELVHGERPELGRHVEVTCGNISCMNPAHLICPTTDERFWSHVEKTEGCWTWTGALTGKGYGSFGFRCEGRIVVVAAHRYAYEFEYGAIEGHIHHVEHLEISVCHRCDNPPCVRPDHLFLGDDAANMADKLAKGRQAKGPALAEAIRKAREAKANMERLCNKAMGVPTGSKVDG